MIFQAGQREADASLTGFTLCSEIDVDAVFSAAVLIFRTVAAQFAVDEGAVYEFAVYPVRMLSV